MRDVLVATMQQLADTWESEAKSRRRFTPADQVADAIDACASELRSEITRAAESSRLLTVEQYAHEHGASPGTVRRWCASGALAAEKNAAGDWMIPRSARRRSRAG